MPRPLRRTCNDRLFQRRRQVIQYLRHRLVPVECVEMEAADAVIQQVEALPGGQVDAGPGHVGRVLEFLEPGGERDRYLHTAEFAEAFNLLEICDGHDAGDDRDVDTVLLETVHHLVEMEIFEEHLRDAEFGAAVYFLFGVGGVKPQVGGIEVALGVNRHADAETLIAPQEANQV